MTMMSTLASTPMIDSSPLTSNNQTGPSAMPVWIRMLTLTGMVLIDVSAFFGNLLIICAFFRTRRLQTVTNYFIASLAFADALVAMFVLPLSIYCYQSDRSWKLGLILCDLWVSSDVLLCTSSILNLACISVDRYMAITKPLTYTAYRSKFLARVMILLVWIVSVVITCPPIFGWRDTNRRQTVEEEHKCDLNSARGYVVYSALGSFYIPGVVMIFVYIRIFMVVYDRENLIKKFHHDQSPNLSVKSNQNGVSPKTDTARQKSRLPTWTSCLCFRRSSPANPPLKKSVSHHSCNHFPSIEQKQNGYLIYRFTNTTAANNPGSRDTHSPTQTPPITPKASMFCRPCKSSTNKLNNGSNDIYQYRRNCLAQVAAEYQFRTDDSPCHEFKTLESSLSPLFKCRSRSFEQSTTSRIRDLNAELSHSRQLKAAAAAAAAATMSTLNKEQALEQQTELDQFILSNQEYNAHQLFPSISEDLHEPTSQSLSELAQISIKQDAGKLPAHPVRMRARSTTNSSIVQLNANPAGMRSNFIRQKQSAPEPTRINRRMKSSRTSNASPSAILIENFKQQHRVTRNASIKSTQSVKSFASLCRLKQTNDIAIESNSKCRWCCCCCCCLPSWNHSSQKRIKQILQQTPNPSITNDDDDDDDDDKTSSNETSNRTPVYTPTHSSSPPRTNANPASTPADVHRRERIRFMKEQKTAKTLAVVVGGFILLWLPFFIMYVIPRAWYTFNPHLVTFITWLGYFNSVINPFIYAYCSKQFRMAFWNITFGMCTKKPNVLSPISSKNKQMHQCRVNA